MIEIRNVVIDDLERVFQIEQQGFNKSEAATKAILKKRIQNVSDSFFVAVCDNYVVGFVCGVVYEKEFIDDDLFDDVRPNVTLGGYQTILSLAVDAEFRNQNIAKMLLDKLEIEAISKKRLTLTLTCKEELIRFYEKFGFVSFGIAESTHGGSIWYNMVKGL